MYTLGTELLVTIMVIPLELAVIIMMARQSLGAQIAIEGNGVDWICFLARYFSPLMAACALYIGIRQPYADSMTLIIATGTVSNLGVSAMYHIAHRRRLPGCIHSR